MTITVTLSAELSSQLQAYAEQLHLSPFVTLDHPLRYILIERLQQRDTFSIAVPALTEFLFGIQTLPAL